MNPIAVTELTRLGSSLLSRGIESISGKPSPQLDPSVFANELSSAEAKPEVIDIENVRSQLLKDPTLANFFKQNTDNTIHVDRLADGSMRLVSSSGDFFTLGKNSKVCQLASDFHTKCLESNKNLSPSRTNSVLLIG